MLNSRARIRHESPNEMMSHKFSDIVFGDGPVPVEINHSSTLDFSLPTDLSGNEGKHAASE
jgi:hypothetical protein